MLKLKYIGNTYPWKHYAILFNGNTVGNIEMSIDDGIISIRHVFIDPDYRKAVRFWEWLKRFHDIYVYDVVPDAVMYWNKQGAKIKSYVPECRFKDIPFTEEELDGFF